MKLFKKPFYLFCISILIYSCTDNYNGFYKSPSIKKDLSIQKIDSFTIHNSSNTNYTIGKLRFSFAINENDSLYAFYDILKKRILIVNNEGAIRHIIGQEGRGPSELVNVTSFNFNEKNEVVLYDQSQTLFKIFDLKDSVLHTAKQHQTLYPVGNDRIYIYHSKIYAATADTKLLGNRSEIRKKMVHSKVAAVFNYKGELIDTLGRYDPSIIDNKGPNFFSNITVDKKRNELLSTQGYNYRIQIFNIENGKRLAWFGHKPAHFNAGNSFISPYVPLRKKRKIVEGLTTPKGAFPTDSYILFIYEKLTTAFLNTKDFNQKDAYLTVYDRQTHACFGDIKLPYILGSVADNKLYLIDDSNPDHFTVGVYEIRQGK